MDKRIIKEIIRDFHLKELPPLTERSGDFSVPPGKIRSVIGVRRSGKTFLFYQLMKNLLKKGISKEQILYINFEDERLLPIKKEDLSLIYEVYLELYPHIKRQKVYLFLDEIQNVPGWEIFVRRLHENENVEISVTGSSSRLLSRELATALRGRTLSFEVFPFSFAEMLNFYGISPDIYSSEGKAYLVNKFEEYLYWGGFPEVLKVDQDFKIMILQDYLNLVLYKDLIERYQIRNQALLKYLLKFLLSNNANPFSINKFFLDVRSQGFKVSKDSIFNYLNYLEDAFWISLVPIYSESIRKQQVNYRKIYVLDNGLVSANRSTLYFNSGRLLESLVFQQLRRKFSLNQIFYYKTSKNSEVDFLILNEYEGKVALIQVSETITEPATQQRELTSLYSAMEELGLSESLIITAYEYATFTRNHLRVQAKPFWDWALGKDLLSGV